MVNVRLGRRMGGSNPLVTGHRSGRGAAQPHTALAQPATMGSTVGDSGGTMCGQSFGVRRLVKSQRER